MPSDFLDDLPPAPRPTPRPAAPVSSDKPVERSGYPFIEKKSLLKFKPDQRVIEDSLGIRFGRLEGNDE